MNDFPARIIDANLNRAGEGLRVIEEYARFVLESPAITESLKKLRHDLQHCRQGFAASVPEGLLQHRDTNGDIGTGISTSSEGKRDNPQSVAMASVKRLQEALRAIEEYGKIISPDTASHVEQMRYTLYDLEKQIFAQKNIHRQLREAKLYVLITESLCSTDSLTACREAIAGGADIIQMREKEAEDKDFLTRATEMREICRAANTLFLINDRPHIAYLADADGIHTGQGDLPVNLSRRIIGDRIIGRSTSTPEIARQAEEDGADYIGVGPVYETNTKQHRKAVGLEYVRHAAQHVNIPYFCIGSINRDTIDDVLEAGANAVAICTAITMASDIAAETEWFKERLIG